MGRGDARGAGEETMSESRSTPCLIWSEEHGAWWKPGRMGYTRSIRDAGRYSLAEAMEIVSSANRYLTEDSFKEVMVYDPE